MALSEALAAVGDIDESSRYQAEAVELASTVDVDLLAGDESSERGSPAAHVVRPGPEEDDLSQQTDQTPESVLRDEVESLMNQLGKPMTSHVDNMAGTSTIIDAERYLREAVSRTGGSAATATTVKGNDALVNGTTIGGGDKQYEVRRSTGKSQSCQNVLERRPRVVVQEEFGQSASNAIPVHQGIGKVLVDGHGETREHARVNGFSGISDQRILEVGPRDVKSSVPTRIDDNSRKNGAISAEKTVDYRPKLSTNSESTGEDDKNRTVSGKYDDDTSVTATTAADRTRTLTVAETNRTTPQKDVSVIKERVFIEDVEVPKEEWVTYDEEVIDAPPAVLAAMKR